MTPYGILIENAPPDPTAGEPQRVLLPLRLAQNRAEKGFMTWDEKLSRYSLLDALRGRRSRRFGLGMNIEGGPLAYQSSHQPVPLSEEEEALLVFAACGVTGHALADLTFQKHQGGNMMAGLLGRTVASGDAIQTVALVVTNDDATYLIRRPQELAGEDFSALVQGARQGRFRELYEQTRTKIAEGRTAPPLEPLFNINVNRWSLHAPGSTYFLPINDMTFGYINGLLEVLNEATGAFILDERASLRPAGIGRFASRKGGHLMDDPRSGRLATVLNVELLLADVIAIEQGMMLQNLGLMTQALGLGGFPNFAEHPFVWFQALDFRMLEMRASRYVDTNPFVAAAMSLSGRNPPVPYPVGLERNGQVLLKAYCPPYYPSMEAAVRAVVDAKLGPAGNLRGKVEQSAWRDPAAVSADIPDISAAAIAATVAYCDYIYKNYGRFPAYLTPFRTVLGYQAAHLDLGFYERYYRPEALTETQREHFARWHQDE